MKPFYPYFGGKAKVAARVWEIIGSDVPAYVEPFLGGGAVFLGRPAVPKNCIEVINDFDCMVTNLWRAISADAAEVARRASLPMNELEIAARRNALSGSREFLRKFIIDNPYNYNETLAGMWLYGQLNFLGDNFASERADRFSSKVPRFTHARSNDEEKLFRAMRNVMSRIRNTRILCGDWKRCLGNWIYEQTTAVFLDPPYEDYEKYYLDGANRTISGDVEEWCADNGEKARIVLCGYEGEHDGLLEIGWRKEKWTAGCGYGTKNNENRHMERLFVSPACAEKETAQQQLLGGMEWT